MAAAIRTSREAAFASGELTNREALLSEQERLGRAGPPLWRWHEGALAGGCFICFGDDDRAFAAAALISGAEAVVEGVVSAPYEPGLLALRELAILVRAVGALPSPPAVLLVNATGRDHLRRAGLALHLGAALDVPSVGVTHRPLYATGELPEGGRGARSPLVLGGDVVGTWLITRRGRRPLAVSPGWRTDLETAVAVVLATSGRTRTPEPIRRARQLARTRRAGRD
jgi:deoxyribonuclease V